jgi:3-hydroxyisobutyrate dehydrogenase-like beta-hydroxyacid dehydrogenase
MERLAERARPSGTVLLDAPVSGGVRGAEARTLSIMVAGDRAAFELARPLLGELGSTVRYLGARPGLGQAAKLANQLMMTVALAGTVEGLALAERYGLERDQVLEVVGAGTGSSWVLEHWDWMRSLWEGYEPGNALDVLLKDMRALFEETGARGHASPVAEAAYERLLEHWQPYMS